MLKQIDFVLKNGLFIILNDLHTFHNFKAFSFQIVLIYNIRPLSQMNIFFRCVDQKNSSRWLKLKCVRLHGGCKKGEHRGEGSKTPQKCVRWYLNATNLDDFMIERKKGGGHVLMMMCNELFLNVGISFQSLYFQF